MYTQKYTLFYGKKFENFNVFFILIRKNYFSLKYLIIQNIPVQISQFNIQ